MERKTVKASFQQRGDNCNPDITKFFIFVNFEIAFLLRIGFIGYGSMKLKLHL